MSQKLLNLCEQFDFPKNYGRRNVHDDLYCHSLVFGLVKRPYFGYTESVANTQHKELYEELRKYIWEHRPEFKYTTITLNYNLECLPHRDKNNKGLSMITGFGKYTGGEFIVEGEKHDINGKWIEFNGHLREHWTSPFSGDRYSVVYYSVR